MTIVVDWDVEPHLKQTPQKTYESHIAAVINGPLTGVAIKFSRRFGRSADVMVGHGDVREQHSRTLLFTA